MNKNKFGIEVGNIFVLSWGYEQTNLNYYQVIELVGKASVRVVEISPKIECHKATSSMSEELIVRSDNTLCERKSFHQFVKDNEKGDLKRVSDKYVNTPYILIDNSLAILYKGQSLYTSSYY